MVLNDNLKAIVNLCLKNNSLMFLKIRDHHFNNIIRYIQTLK